MELYLYRQYFTKGTNGSLYAGGVLLCHTIELPWRDNMPNKSCIPEGVYALTVRTTAKRGLHLLVNNVPKRSLILIHPANNALRELKGCIAPVMQLTGEGMGEQSRVACEKLLAHILTTKSTVTLTIRENNHK